MKHTLSYRFGHPNPQFFRENYNVLNGEWDFVFDFLDEGIDKEYNKYQQLKFTPILSSPYIKCPNCGKRKYLKFRFD